MGTFVRDIPQRYCIHPPFCGDQQGQDLTEYALLLAFVVIAAAGLFLASGSSIVTIWSVSNNMVTAAAQQAQAAS
jgi:Flp pilus assembly pilin Flp